jgi:hypothetical protein
VPDGVDPARAFFQFLPEPVRGGSRSCAAKAVDCGPWPPGAGHHSMIKIQKFVVIHCVTRILQRHVKRFTIISVGGGVAEK